MVHTVLSPAIAIRPTLDIARPSKSAPKSDLMQRLVREAGVNPIDLVRTFGPLAFGPGRLTLSDFVNLRLFDKDHYGAAPLRGFVGQRRNRDICAMANYRYDWHGVLKNKIAADHYLAACGFPTIPVRAIFAPAARSASAALLTDRASLERFLTDDALYPLFGKPADGFQSLGSIGLRGYRRDTKEIELSDGSFTPLSRFVDDILAHYEDGYLFQALAQPHAAIQSLCGPRLATVRFLTIRSEDGVRIFRAAWKIPAGSNSADNFWRPGNLLAKIDPVSGIVSRALSGRGLDATRHDEHPDTGLRLAGFAHPLWDEMRALARAAADLMRHVPMIGWDIACTQDGPVIVEMNETPDFFLNQFAEGRGVLDDEFAAFLAFQQRQAKRHEEANAADVARLSR